MVPTRGRETLIRANKGIVILGAMMAASCTVHSGEGVSTLSPRDRPLVTRFGFPKWHRLEKARYGRGAEHAVVVVAARASRSLVERVVQVQNSLCPGCRGYEEAFLALGLLLSGRSQAAAKQMLEQISPEVSGPTRPDIHPRAGASLAAGALISGRSAADALGVFARIESDRSHTQRERALLALASMVSGRSPVEVVSEFEKVLDRTAHAGAAAALTIGVVSSGVSAAEVYQHWQLVGDQALCGPVDAALLVGGGYFAESRDPA